MFVVWRVPISLIKVYKMILKDIGWVKGKGKGWADSPIYDGSGCLSGFKKEECGFDEYVEEAKKFFGVGFVVRCVEQKMSFKTFFKKQEKGIYDITVGDLPKIESKPKPSGIIMHPHKIR